LNSIKKIKEKGLSVFLTKFVVFIIILVILDFTIGSVLQYFYFKQDTGFLYRTTYSLDSTTAKFLIFGSSTANHHYDPSIFENKLGMTVYNTGRDANTIFYNYGVFQSILKRYRPKVAILDFNVGEFKVLQNSYDGISSLLPYYKSNPELMPIIQLKSPFERLKLLSKIYPYNSLLFSILIGNTDYNKSRDYINDKQGYIPLNRVWNKKISPAIIAPKYEIDTIKIRLLRSFITECKNVNIRLYICISPRLVKYTDNDLSVEIVEKIAKKYKVPFYNFSNDTLFWNHPEYFVDLVHLNKTGAEVFSNEVVDKIIKNQKQLLMESKKSLRAE
jgi:hypothetical protein